jgi:hypothetical protein
MGATFGDLIAKSWRRMEPIPPQTIKVTANYTAGSGTITLDTTANNFAAIVPGQLLCIGLNVLLVYGQPNSTSGVTTVVGGMQGSTDASATLGTLAYLNPRFTPYDISTAVNDELLALSAPNKGLGQIATVDVTFVPTFNGYDLGSQFDTLRSRVLEVSYQLPEPQRQNPLIRRGRYRVIRSTNTSTNVFPSGNGIILYDQAFPGFQLQVTFIAPFSPLVNLTDDLESVAGVPPSMQDILDMGVELRLAPDKEIQRDAMDFQRDPRKAAEVGATAMLHSGDALLIRYRGRIDDEASNIKRAWRQSEGW